MVVAEFASLRGETEICDRGDGNVCFGAQEREAVSPGILGFVLEV